MEKYFFLIFLFLFPVQSPSQEVGSFFHHLSTTKGLSQAINAYLYHDSRGFVWISSIDGFNRFDGLNVKVYRHSPQQARSMLGQNVYSPIFESSKGDLWFCTLEAIHCYRRNTDDFDTWQISSPVTGEKITDNYYVFHLDQKGQLWVKNGDAQSQLYLFDTHTDTCKLIGPLYGNRCIVDTTSAGVVTGIYSFDYGKKTKVYYNKVIDQKSISNQSLFNPDSIPTVRDLWIAKNDSVWFATNQGLLLFNRNDDTTIYYPSPNKSTLYAVEPLNETQLAVSSSREGLLVFDLEERKFVQAIKNKPLRESSISANGLNELYLDRSNTLWISDWNYGLNFIQLDKNKMRHIELANIGNPCTNTDEIIRFLAEDQIGNVWCATQNKGLLKFDPEQHATQFCASSGIPATQTYALYCDKQGNLWTISNAGIFYTQPSTSKETFQLLSGSDTSQFSEKAFFWESNDGRLLLYNHGVYEIKKNPSSSNYEFIKSDLLNILGKEFSSFIYQDRAGNYYCNINDQKTKILQTNGHIHTLGLNNLKACYEPIDSPFIWLATTYGLAKLDKQTLDYTLYDESNVLPNQYLYCVIPDDRGNLWLSSNKGIIRFDPLTESATQYGLADGVWEYEFYSNAFLKTSTGEIWMGNRNTLNIFHPSSIQPVSHAPQIQVTKLLVNDLERKDSLYIGESNRLVFPYFENTLSFEVVALEYSDPANNRLAYRLKNYDTDWLKLPKGVPGFIRYPQIPPGKYTLELKAWNSDGIESEIKQIDLLILKPFWWQWWFILLSLLTGISMVYLLYRYRLNQLLRLERLRSQISADLHDDIGGTLSNINILCTLINRKIEKDSPLRPLLHRIEEEVQSSAESLDDIIWSINPLNDSFDRVLARMRRFVSEILEAKDINGTLEFPKGAKSLRLDMVKRRQFYLLFKEAVNNLAKYSHCQNVIITIVYQHKRLHMTIYDDGTGFIIKEKNGIGNGLQSMQQRAQRLNGYFDIQSAPGQGTTIKVIFPITEIGD